MSERIMIGSRVVHTFSKQQGEVLAHRRDLLKYNYKVRFFTNEGSYTDWFKREVIKLWKLREK